MQNQMHKQEWLVESGLANANFWETLVDNKVKCHLCPRHCLVFPENFGFCNTRYNDQGMLKTAIWGKMLTPSIEPIETEAVFHYWPGAKILSLGNLGCNLECDFCQNWESSNIKNLTKKHIKYYNPKEIIALAKSIGIEIISFTYNDPVIWFEFVYETAKLAHENNMKTLFKSAGFISLMAAKYLTKVIDIFSISIKSSNAVTFQNMSKGNIENVLEATKIFYQSNRHLEISNLVIPGLTDVEKDVMNLVKWIKKELSEEVPLHFVRFHPAYKYTNVDRTPINFLIKARRIALNEGLKYVYIGNTYEDNHADIVCSNCGQVMIKRFGLYTEIGNISLNGICLGCNQHQKIKLQPFNGAPENQIKNNSLKNKHTWQWLNKDTRNLHIEAKNESNERATLICEHLKKRGELLKREITDIPGNTEIRIAIGQKNIEDKKINIMATDNLQCRVLELLDRAHFPLEKANL